MLTIAGGFIEVVLIITIEMLIFFIYGMTRNN